MKHRILFTLLATGLLSASHVHAADPTCQFIETAAAKAQQQPAWHSIMEMEEGSRVEIISLGEARELYSAIAGMQGNLAGIVNEQAGSSTRKSGQDVDDLGDEAWLSGATFGDPAGGQNDKHIINDSVLTVRQGKRILNLDITGSLVDKGLGKRMVALMRSIEANL